MNSCVCYWNMIRQQHPNIHVRLHKPKLCSSNPYICLGEAVWIACPLEDKDLESRFCAFLS
ncbi:hypothetical protein PCC7424_3786 [Gloeothece citriformis PCC 7424]|uniref:Uncharacterized protein n=1 Tax=Gloeothece citriformis (strain PCC 7424) TaxID=65393 RepID=B7KJ83_GLOC7|nr:hypothetical protein [Gloeothece citriformis]ACK72167.1 hypothetical protein PCC7424_3786 [Gloeothece citriformis PCC 7424]